MKITTPDGVDREVEPRPYIMLAFNGGSPVPFTVGTSGGLQTTAGGITTRVAAEFTRPADTTQYAASDAVSDSTATPTIMTFANVARIDGGTGIILTSRLTTNSATVTNASFRLYIFNAPVAATNDNAAFPLTYANLAKRVGSVDFILGTEGANSDCAAALVSGLNIDYAAANDSRNLYGILVARGAYVPVSGQKFTLELGVAND